MFAGPSSPGGSWAGPSVHDVDNDGDADIVREGYVIDGPTGLLTVEAPPDYVAATHGTSAVVAQLDQDPGAELTDGSYVWGLDLEAHAWVREPAWQQSTSASGFAAVEDFDPHAPFSVEAVHVATVSSGKMTIMSLDHTLERYVEAALPSGGGGPPVVADFDGDGLPEVGVATAGYYLVIDPDCSAAPRSGGACASRDQCEHAPLGACPTFVLWSRDGRRNVGGALMICRTSILIPSGFPPGPGAVEALAAMA